MGGPHDDRIGARGTPGANTATSVNPEDHRREIELTVHTTDDALAQLKEQLRTNRLALPSHRRVQEATRYAMTVEDIEEQEQQYQQFAGTSGGIFELEDVIDTLAQARSTGVVISSVMSRYLQDAGPPVDRRRGEINWVALVILVAIAAYVLIGR